MAQSCRTCIWWHTYRPSTLEKQLGPKFGECRRSAPRLKFNRHSDDTESCWPPTGAEDWCGEHRPDMQPSLPLETSDA